MNDSDFHRVADATLARLADRLDDADASGALDVELLSGVLTIGLPAGKTVVVSKHGPSRQVWVSSPVSGGLHFSWDGQAWLLADGTEMEALLADELGRLSGVKM